MGDVKIPVQFPSGESTSAYIFVRPYTKETLEKLSIDFEIIVFTASHKCYADEVLDYLDPDNNLISHRLFREHCY
jgi:CTD small phosphatase-like protein 2